jgi:hypothetical protein
MREVLVELDISGKIGGPGEIWSKERAEKGGSSSGLANSGDDRGILGSKLANAGKVASANRLGFHERPPTPRQQAPALRKDSAVVRWTPPVGMRGTWGSGLRRVRR